jgi:hypothetical protein
MWHKSTKSAVVLVNWMQLPWNQRLKRPQCTSKLEPTTRWNSGNWHTISAAWASSSYYLKTWHCNYFRLLLRHTRCWSKTKYLHRWLGSGECMVDLNLVSSLRRLVDALTDTCVYQAKRYSSISHAPSPLSVMSCSNVTFDGTSIVDIFETQLTNKQNQKKKFKAGLTYICDIQIGETLWSKA